ncbi:unnamed protein product [Hymenolepis diminuta]|uniref:Secreted protein n=1 Tax=Hymenolepis diminuta TaxID=6216 RepID=A0A0R3SN58_HYMDI|nr:unnamed protein product [Hymenolepis diminuta]
MIGVGVVGVSVGVGGGVGGGGGVNRRRRVERRRMYVSSVRCFTCAVVVKLVILAHSVLHTCFVVAPVVEFSPY